MKTNELTGAALDWAVAKCEGHDPLQYEAAEGAWHTGNWLPSIDWSQGGPIIEREDIALWPDEDNPGSFFASTSSGAGKDYAGASYLIAAMRCYVAIKLGDTVEVPDGLA